MKISHAFLKASASNSKSSSELPRGAVSLVGWRNFIKLIDARLHAESSRNMYSEQGLLALIRAVFGQVCQSFTVESNCMPGSPQIHVASAIWRMRSRAL